MKQDALKKKAINIKGKKYILVSDRVIFFNEAYPNGCIQTEQLESTDRVEFKAKVIPDASIPDRFFTGHSQAVWGDGNVNRSSALENAETSAVGRALGMMAIGVLDSIASVDEINKAVAQGLSYDPSMERAPFCSICGKQAMKAKTKQGRVFWTCPDWMKHKEAGVKPEMVQKKEELAPEIQDFMKDMGEEEVKKSCEEKGEPYFPQVGNKKI